jgi:transposase
MPRKTISRDLKVRVLILFYEQHFSVKKTCGILAIKKSLAYKTLEFHHTYGTAYNPHARRYGQRRSLAVTDMAFIYNLLEQRHCTYLDELQTELFSRRGVWCSTPTLLRTLRRLHFSQKCVTTKAIERNDLQRSHFMLRIGQDILDPSMLMFIDEAAKNERTTGRKCGWSLKGRRCIQRRVFICGQQWSILPVLTLDGIITYDIIPGSVTSRGFYQFLHDHVV